MYFLIPDDRPARWALLQQFIERWMARKLTPADGCSQDSIEQGLVRLPIPAALREWYALAGRYSSFWSRQDEFVPPENLSTWNGHAIIYVENQSVVQFGIKLSDLKTDDPPVYEVSMDDSSVWTVAAPTVSQFALQMSAYVLKFAEGPFSFSYGGARDRVALRKRVAETYDRWPFRPWQWVAPEFYGDMDTVIQFEDSNVFYVCVRTSVARDLMYKALDGWVDWDEEIDHLPNA